MKSVRSKVLIAVTLGSALVLASCNKGEGSSNSTGLSQSEKDQLNNLSNSIENLVNNGNNGNNGGSEIESKPEIDKIVDVKNAYFYGNDTSNKDIVLKCPIKNSENMEITDCDEMTLNNGPKTNGNNKRDLLIYKDKAIFLGNYLFTDAGVLNNKQGVLTQCSLDGNGDFIDCKSGVLEDTIKMDNYKNAKIFNDQIIILAKNDKNNDIIRTCALNPTEGLNISSKDLSIQNCSDKQIPDSDWSTFFYKGSPQYFDVDKKGTLYISQSGQAKRSFLTCKFPADKAQTFLSCHAPVSSGWSTSVQGNESAITVVNNKIIHTNWGTLAIFDIVNGTYKNAVQLEDGNYFDNRIFMDTDNTNTVAINDRIFTLAPETGSNANGFKKAVNCSFSGLTDTGINGENKDYIERTLDKKCSYVFSKVSSDKKFGNNKINKITELVLKSVAFK